MVMGYFFSLLFIVLVREQAVENVSDYFEDVPRAFLTIFRCSFGDCSTASGTPIFEHMSDGSGPQNFRNILTLGAKRGMLSMLRVSYKRLVSYLEPTAWGGFKGA